MKYSVSSFEALFRSVMDIVKNDLKKVNLVDGERNGKKSYEIIANVLSHLFYQNFSNSLELVAMNKVFQNRIKSKKVDTYRMSEMILVEKLILEKMLVKLQDEIKKSTNHKEWIFRNRELEYMHAINCYEAVACACLMF